LWWFPAFANGHFFSWLIPKVFVMPRRIVDQYRTLYYEYFDRQTLDVRLNNDELKLRVFDEQSQLGFKGNWIVVRVGEPSHPKILACNIVSQRDTDGMDAVIIVNPDPNVLALPADKYKVMLAHEWIEAMMAFRDKGRPDKQLNLAKIEMALLFNSLHLRSPWQDSPDFSIEMHGALRRLLVSRELVSEMTAEFGTSLEQIKKLLEAKDRQVAELVRKIGHAFAQRHSVDHQLVFDRFLEILFEGPSHAG
jgi:hypothetical protein